MSDLGSGLNDKRRTQDAFGERLKARRDLLGLTQDYLAQKTGISRAAIQAYESGKIPKGDYLLILSDLLDCSIDWLLKGTEVRESAPPAAQPEPQAAQASAPQPEEDFKMSDMITKTVEVLESDTIYRTALASNIRAFHQAVRSERTLAQLEERVAILEAKLDGMAQIEARMTELEKENEELKRRLERHDENTAKAVGADG